MYHEGIVAEKGADEFGLHITIAQAQDLYRITRSVRKTNEHYCGELVAYMRRRLNGEDEFAECYMPTPEWRPEGRCAEVSPMRRTISPTPRRIRAFLLLRGISLKREYYDITCDRALKELSQIDDPYLMMQIRFAQDCRKRVVLNMFQDLETYQLMNSIPGFSTLSSAYFTSLIIDIDRFPDSKRFTSSFGVVPKIRSSSDSNANCATTHRGDDHAGYLLMFCVLGHVKHQKDSVVTLMYRRLVERGKPKWEAMVAAGRKLLTVVYSVLKNRRPYVSDSESLLLSHEDEESEREDFCLKDVSEEKPIDRFP